MDKEKFKSSQNSQDWLDSLSDAMNFTLTGESENFFQETHGRINTERFFHEAQERMNNERMNSEKFFQEACERIKASTTRSADFFTVMKENELRSSSKSRFSAMERESHEIIRSFSAGSGWNVQSSEGHISPVSSEECKTPVKSAAQLVTATKPRSQLYSFGGFSRTNHLMSFSLSGTRCFENWSSSSCKLQMSRSTFEYPMSGSMLRSYQETFDVSESESDDDDSPDQSHWPSLPAPRPLSIAPSECTDTSSICTSDGEKSSILAIEASPDHRKEKAYRLANEILTTERSYVQILHLIDQVFHFRVDQENRAHPMFPQEMIPQMFSNIKSIYKLHHDFLLPQLETRMANWEQELRIGDIMKDLTPFLKMYTEYIKNFDNAMNIINALVGKNHRFAAIMDEIHQMPECGGLTLSHHMLSPIQRIPRYELLLKEYLKKLPDDSRDREDTESALHSVSTAANHANEAMKKIDKFKQLLEIQENISGVVDLVSPTRELLKEGKIVKISARSGDHQERYLFLFTDILLLCSSRLISKSVILGPVYRLRAKFNMETIEIVEGDNLETENTFYVRDNHKNVELYTHTVEEKSAWLDALFLAIQELCKRKSSLKLGADSSTSIEMELGKKVPNYIKMESVTKCMDCATSFGVIKRKHHCRACGIVLCGKCSNQRFPLPFEDNKASRVCRHCHQVLSQRSATTSPDRSPDNFTPSSESTNILYSKEKGVLEVSADANSVLSGYLLLKTSKTWAQRWFSLHDDFVLYSFRSHTDNRALTATPLPGFTVVKGSELKNESFSDKERVFKMYHSRKIYHFQANCKDEADKWVLALQMASRAELPSPDDIKR